MKRLFVKLLQGFLALLGVAVATSCDDIIGGTICAYGTPTMDYTISGKVVNARNETLKDIRVKMLYEKNFLVMTDAKGAFAITKNRTFNVAYDKGKYYVPLIFDDTTGVYRKDTVLVELAKVIDCDDQWYIGVYQAKDLKITMEDK